MGKIFVCIVYIYNRRVLYDKEDWVVVFSFIFHHFFDGITCYISLWNCKSLSS
jgi:hypothetical protein